ncbi:alpha-L-rhamnosidase-related protein [Paenibacillus endoradicis]|uniref:alpha-L-rhamnosidase-related protein n=1 Tax=Paenibacillus endoradicis TaxID=2972487 RepID=UPI0021598795|nr:sugar hydrolase [Paenibacillus endoradicis]MCR8657021.1 sugar hydrolase [Paenibacillus endoradicis]
MLINQQMVEKAEKLIPSLQSNEVEVQHIIEVIADDAAFQGWSTKQFMKPQEWKKQSYGKGDSFIVDFGDHYVGYVELAIRSVGSPPDAPLKLKLTFGEMPCEIAEPFESYDGWLSSSWLQEELMFVDVLPAEIKLPRRYCFRYIKVEVLDTSVKYKVAFDYINCKAVTSGDMSKVTALPSNLPYDIVEMDRIAIKTLQNCMQTVFEDGPKRDRRLWIGDLRLQAQANYYTIQNYDLVKRCLYLFGGMRLEDGTVGACVFEKPYAHVDDTKLFDYALFFVAVLHDYYKATQDMDTLQELWPIALEQLEIGLSRLDVRGIVTDDSTWWCFTDWHDELNKQASAQAVLIYCLKHGRELAIILGQEEQLKYITENIEFASNASMKYLWDEKAGFFVSGEERQISWASQIWMALAEVLPSTHNSLLLTRLFEDSPSIGMTTPYMYHHLIEALFLVGNKEQAIAEMQAYWGAMMQDGANTFWELYNPKDKKLSPYGSNLINSYCHAWSCTPTYFIRKYLI